MKKAREMFDVFVEVMTIASSLIGILLGTYLILIKPSAMIAGLVLIIPGVIILILEYRHQTKPFKRSIKEEVTVAYGTNCEVGGLAIDHEEQLVDPAVIKREGIIEFRPIKGVK